MKRILFLSSSIIRSLTVLVRAHTVKTMKDVRVDAPAFDLRRDR